MVKQLGLFDPPPVKPRNFDEAALVRRLRTIDDALRFPAHGLSRSSVRRLMTPLPRITALD